MEAIEQVESNRQKGMSVKDACAEVGITPASYYAKRNKKRKNSIQFVPPDQGGPEWKANTEAEPYSTSPDLMRALVADQYLALREALHLLEIGSVNQAEHIIRKALTV